MNIIVFQEERVILDGEDLEKGASPGLITLSSELEAAQPSQKHSLERSRHASSTPGPRVHGGRMGVHQVSGASREDECSVGMDTSRSTLPKLSRLPAGPPQVPRSSAHRCGPEGEAPSWRPSPCSLQGRGDTVVGS